MWFPSLILQLLLWTLIQGFSWNSSSSSFSWRTDSSPPEAETPLLTWNSDTFSFWICYFPFSSWSWSSCLISAPSCLSCCWWLLLLLSLTDFCSMAATIEIRCDCGARLLATSLCYFSLIWAGFSTELLATTAWFCGWLFLRLRSILLWLLLEIGFQPI